ncbi:unnamed protein product [Auanema sp. JU1783]|nr:unnamed protein product [Auanema sp. JU1783]
MKQSRLEVSPSLKVANVSRLRPESVGTRKTYSIDYNNMEADPNRIRLTTKKFLKKKMKEIRDIFVIIDKLKPQTNLLNAKLNALDMKAKFTWEVFYDLLPFIGPLVISEFSIFNKTDVKTITKKYDDSIKSNLHLHLNRWRQTISQIKCFQEYEKQKESETEAKESLRKKKLLLEQRKRDLEDIKLIDEQTQRLQSLSFSEARVEIFKMLKCSLPESKTSKLSDSSSVSSSDSPPFLSDEEDNFPFL